jgi:hypothetical protein
MIASRHGNFWFGCTGHGLNGAVGPGDSARMFGVGIAPRTGMVAGVLIIANHLHAS